jgi:hypothetical protein
MRKDSAVPRRAAVIAALAVVAVGAGRLATRGAASSTGPRSPSPASSGTPAVPVSTPSSASPAASPVGATPSPSPSPVAAELPRGGREVFPRYRLVGYCGAPGSPALGRLGIGRLDDRVKDIEKVARGYAVDRDPLPVLELIAVVVQAHPGADGRYRVRIGDDVVRTYLDAARRHGALLLLNVQPGRARFLDEVKALERWLREPDVGVALDPEWAVGPGQTPGRVFGSTTGTVVDGVAAYLDALVRAGGLPQKVLVVHQLNPRIVTGWEALRRRRGVVVVKSVDGIGNSAEKISTWNRLVTRLPSTLHPGFKLFFDEDRRDGGTLMSPAQVLALGPRPEYVLYE